MTDRRPGRPVDGVLALDKPTGVSSNQILQQVRRLYRARKAGHGGTLDPFAEGALVILFGEATKFGHYFLAADKTYRVTMRFGSATDSDDCTGQVIATKAPPDFATIDWPTVLAPFHGEIEQVPPSYSALKIAGKRAYALARAGNPVILPPRQVVINSICVVACNASTAETTLTISCGKGTYIRALVRDIARALGSVAHAVKLRRLSCGRISSNLHPLERLTALDETRGLDALDDLLLPVASCVAHLPRADIAAERMPYIGNGNDIATRLPAGEYALYTDARFFGVGYCRDGRLFPKRLFHLR